MEKTTVLTVPEQKKFNKYLRDCISDGMEYPAFVVGKKLKLMSGQPVCLQETERETLERILARVEKL